MAIPNSTYNEMATVTIDSRTGKLADNFSKNSALLYRLRQKGKMKTFSGGININQELAYAQNGTFTRFSGYDTVNISPSDVFTTASYGIKQASVAVSISRLEQLQNSGKEAIIDLLESRVENAERTLIDSLAVDCYSDGTASGSKQIGGLNYLIPATASTTVGGIASGTWTFWEPYRYDFSALSIAPGSTTIQAAMNTTYMSVSRGPDHTDLIVADNTYYGYYWASLQGNQRFTNSSLAEAGFDNIRFMGADVVFDGGIGGGMTGTDPYKGMFFLNTNYLFFRPHSQENFVSADPGARYATNQLAMVKLITWAGNMTVSNRSLQGRIQD